MRTDTRRALGLAVGLALSTAGCSTIGRSVTAASDLDRVRALSNTPAVTLGEDVDTGATADRILATPLDGDAAVTLALLNNRELRARLHALGIPRGRLIEAGTIENPDLEVELLPERDTTLEVRVEQEITSILLAPLRAEAAAYALDAARHEVAGAVVGLAYEVRTAIYALAAAEERLAIGRRALDAFAATRDAARALEAAGSIPTLDASSRVVAFERARLTTARLELDVVDRREQLQRLLGLHGHATTWRLASSLPRVPPHAHTPDGLEGRAIGASLELAALRSQLEGLARQTGVTRLRGWLPHVSIDVHGLGGTPEDSRDDTRWRTGAGISLSVPLFDRQQGALAATEAEFDATLQRYHGLAVDIRSRAREARARLASAHARARQLADVVVPSLQRIVAETLRQYNAMQADVFTLLRARRDELDAELIRVETTREYWSAAAALDALLAGRRVALAPTTDSAAPNAGAAEGGH